MDLVASFSLLCDIPIFIDMITFSSDDDNRHLTLERMAKAAQAGARSARIMQVISMVQLFRLRRKRLSIRRKTEKLDRRPSRSITDSDCMDGEIQLQMTTLKPQTRVGEKLTEMTLRKVILGILILLSVLPVFDSWIFYGYPTSFEDGGLLTLHNLYAKEGNSPGFLKAVEDYKVKNIYWIAGRKTGLLISLKIQNVTLVESSEQDANLRKTEKQSSRILNEDKVPVTESWIDVRWDIQFQALLDIGRVTFLLAMLSLGAIFFIRDADSLVLRPIERMVHRVKMMSENPLASNGMSLETEEYNGPKQLETKILERSIGKVCHLLSVGFGEAGAEIIANNMKSTGGINPMLPGKKVAAIFGFCDIRNFTSATEVLQEDIMEFVNCIASIVHAEVSFHGGAANKNIGDAFLVVWKLPESREKATCHTRGSIIDAKTALHSSHNENVDHDSEEIRHLADAALASILIINSALKRSRKLKEFCGRDDIQERMPGFTASMGFGVHVGWAIEGAIGSHYKIDPSYLSPHVNMAARLEAATKQYEVPMLLSEAFISLLSPHNQRRCRAIDTVMVVGSKVPTRLYTINADFIQTNEYPIDRFKNSIIDSVSTETEAGHVSYSDYPYLDEYEEHPDILSINWMSSPESGQILSSFDKAYNLYLLGEWHRAIRIFESLQDFDGPSRTLLRYMKSQGGSCPAAWKGCRELTEK
jgi:class 3 adenylate cyclase